MKKVVAILTTDLLNVGGWLNGLAKHPEISFDVIDIKLHNWLEKCLSRDYDLYLLRSPGSTDLMKQMFDERISILVEEFGKFIYPPSTEIKIYENKKYLSYWLKAKDIPHPKTEVFYDKKDATEFARNTNYPIVAKINIGSSGKGVKIIKSIQEANKYIRAAFRKGIRPYIGPNFRTAPVLKKLSNAIKNKSLIERRLRSYKTVYKEPQKYVIFQEFIPHSYEWRAVAIGESFFAHKKIVTGEKASGSLIKDYGDPTLNLMNFVRDICNKGGITSASFDIFETKDGFLVNEIQTFFGQSDPIQMKVKGVPGRYRYIDNKWVFEPGDWAANECYDLRLEHALNTIDKNNI